MAKFSKSRVRGGSALFLKVPEFLLKHSVGYCRWKKAPIITCQIQLDSFSHLSRTPTCDRQTQTQGHGIYRASIASRGKNARCIGWTRKQVAAVTVTISRPHRSFWVTLSISTAGHLPVCPPQNSNVPLLVRGLNIYNTRFLSPPRVHSPNSSSVLQCSRLRPTDTCTDRHTDTTLLRL